MTITDTTAPQARGSSLGPEQLAKLRPHVIASKNGRLAGRPSPKPKDVDGFVTAPSDIDAIFSTHLPAFLEEHDGTVPIVLYAHGGLVDKGAGFEIAQRQVQWWRDNGVYPIHFVWESGLWTSLGDALTGTVVGRGEPTDITDGLIERTLRFFGGERVWGEMKLDAAAASEKDGAGERLIAGLAKWIGRNPNRVTVHAVGHSAGSIFHSHLIPVAIAAGIRFTTVNLLAPAVRIDTFKHLVLEHARGPKIDNLAVFTMDDKHERGDNCWKAYRKSLLYLVSGAFEPVVGTRILGMEKFLRSDDALDTFFSSGPGKHGELITSPRGGQGDSSKSTSTSHGGFDTDAPTMESVARRVTGRTTLRHPFPRVTPRTADLQLAERPVDRSTTHARRALCIGVDDYPDDRDKLRGAVADAKKWGEAFDELGFTVRPLTNGDATRDNILRALLELVTTSRRGDVLAVQYSGHGTTYPDRDKDEGDVDDEAICPVDFRREGRLIIDDDLARIWDLLPDGVRLTMFADSCHSGSVNRAPVELPADARRRSVELTDADKDAFRDARGLGTRRRKAARDRVLQSEQRPTGSRVPRASGGREGLVSACRSTEVAWESEGHGHFTRVAVPLLVPSARKRLSNRAFVDEVVAGMGEAPLQNPEWHGTSQIARRPLLSSAPARDADDEIEEGITAHVEAGGTEPVILDGTAAPAGRNAAIAEFLRATAALLES